MKKLSAIFFILLVFLLCSCSAPYNALRAQVSDLNAKVNQVEKHIESAPAETPLESPPKTKTVNDYSFFLLLAVILIGLSAFFILYKNNKAIQKKQDQAERIALQPFIIPVTQHLENYNHYGSGRIVENLSERAESIIDKVTGKKITQNKPPVSFNSRHAITFGLRNAGKDIAFDAQLYLARFGAIENGRSRTGRYWVENPQLFFVSPYLLTDGVFLLEIEITLPEDTTTLTFNIEYKDKTKKRKYTQNIDLIKEGESFAVYNIPSTIEMQELDT